ncbi:MAG: YHYH protein [Pseudomonadota bacterium]
MHPRSHIICLTALMLGLTPAGHAHSGGSKIAFSHDTLNEAALAVPCTLETGVETECLQIKLKHKPANLEIGPFCPDSLETKGGIWNWTGDAPGLYRINASFLEMIAHQGFQMFAADGSVYISDIAKAAPQAAHSCIQISEDETVEITALIPLHPIMAERPTPLGIVNKVGIALNGTPIFSDAPSVHHTGHMPALDTCGGHVDPGGWYHWHANASDIESVFEAGQVEAVCHLHQDASQLFGYAFDGYPIYGSREASGDTPENLDECNGHIGEMPNGVVGYHYHTGDSFPNLPKCLSGVAAIDNFRTTAQVGIGANPPPGTEITRLNPPGAGHDRGRHRRPPDLSEAAFQLGIPEQDLRTALRRSGRPPDLANAAETLGISEQALSSALPSRPPR